MKLISLVLILSFASFETHACAQHEAKDYLKNILWITEEHPPYNYSEPNGELSGISVDILSLVYRELGMELQRKTILNVPWARLFHNVKNYSQNAAFSMATTDERSKLFHLVALPFKAKVSIMVLKERQELLSQKKLNELNVAVVRRDMGHQLLELQKLPVNKALTINTNSMLKMLIKGRVDAIAYAEDTAIFELAKIADDQIVPIYELEGHALYNYAFNNDTPQCVIDLFSSILNDLDRNGVLSPIRDKYLHH
ncbi:substrate-binding periplasmic protein [Colwelliaceae bacterium 6471]